MIVSGLTRFADTSKWFRPGKVRGRHWSATAAWRDTRRGDHRNKNPRPDGSQRALPSGRGYSLVRRRTPSSDSGRDFIRRCLHFQASKKPQRLYAGVRGGALAPPQDRWRPWRGRSLRLPKHPVPSHPVLFQQPYEDVRADVGQIPARLAARHPEPEAAAQESELLFRQV